MMYSEGMENKMTATKHSTEGIEIHGPRGPHVADVLTPEALAFIARLQRQFGATREALLLRRDERQHEFDAGHLPDFLADTRRVREDSSWRVAPVPRDLADRRV